MKIANTPPKGTSDWYPEEYKIREYIFKAWRDVCHSYGYQEYLTPLFETADLYRAKSGEDIGGKELMTFTDKGGREYALRPEMTPSVTRMVTRFYDGVPKPIRLFSIANYVRNEKPQKGRNREFWQLNYDVFGSTEIAADIEIMEMAIQIMLYFNPPKDSFVLQLNNRNLIETILNDIARVPAEQRQEVVRVLDKAEKIGATELQNRLQSLGLDAGQITTLEKFINSNNEAELLENIPELVGTKGLEEVQQVTKALASKGFKGLFEFKPNVIRGFDYYNGIVFEVFDRSEENNRSLFGGGRYNGLASLFGNYNIPAVGAAPGDETMRIFLENWGLIKQISESSQESYYLPILDENAELEKKREELKSILRSEGYIIISGLKQETLGKALKYADKSGVDNVIILGSEELKSGNYKIKNLASGEEEELKL